MNKNQNKEHVERLKQDTKELLESIGTDTEEEQRILTLIYGFVRSGFLESRVGKGGAA